MKSFAFAALTAYASASGDIVYNYMENGNDWADLCSSGTEQSPIDLDFFAQTEVSNLAAQPEWYASSSTLSIALPAAPTERNAKPKAAIKVMLAGEENASLVGDAQLRLRLPGADADTTW